MAGIWEHARALAERIRSGEFRGGAVWVEPGNWITRSILSGELEQLSLPARRHAYDLAPDNVVIAASPPRTAPGEETDERDADGRVARAG